MRNPLPSLRHEGGFKIIYILLSMGMMGVTALGVLRITKRMADSNRSQFVPNAASLLRDNFVKTFEDDQAWEQTIKDPANQDVKCQITPNVSCAKFAAIASRPLVLRNAKGEVFFDATDPKGGFSPTGEHCKTFPSPQCPLRFDIQWRAMCEESNPQNCFGPAFELREAMLYDAADKSPAPFPLEVFGYSLLVRAAGADAARPQSEGNL